MSREIGNIDDWCFNCRTMRSNKWWKCCPEHTPEFSGRVACSTCYGVLHPTDKAVREARKKMEKDELMIYNEEKLPELYEEWVVISNGNIPESRYSKYSDAKLEYDKRKANFNVKTVSITHKHTVSVYSEDLGFEITKWTPKS